MIKFAKQADIPEIMNFIDFYWKKDHILARDNAFFKYLYITQDNRVNFALSRNEANQINGIIGFIPYDSHNENISLALWKALPEQNTFVGLELFDFLIENLKPVTVATLGINIETSGEIYLLYNYKIGTMKHWYRLAAADEYKIATVTDKQIPAIQGNTCKNIVPLYRAEEIPPSFKHNKNALPKNKEYMNRRYFHHPIYTYQAFLFDEDIIVITRNQTYNHSACLRIVDILGDYTQFNRTIPFFDNYMKEKSIEYIDCYNVGLSDEVFLKAGFKDVSLGKNIIPEHFSPFESKNIDIHYSTSNENIILFKGDGDMDRPN